MKAPMAEQGLLEQVLNSWRVNNEINLRLLAGMPEKGLEAVLLMSRGRNVAQQFVHMHKVRVTWMRYNAAKEVNGLPEFGRETSPRRAQLKRAFRAAGKAVGAYLKRHLEKGRRIRYFKGKPVRWMSYLIAHESHHRGQIALALKQNGMRLPDKVALGALRYTWWHWPPKRSSR